MGYGRLAREFSQSPPAILQTNYVIKLRPPATEKRNPTPHSPCPGKTALDRRLANNDPGDPTTDSDYPKDFVCFLVKQLRSAALPTMAIRSPRIQPRSVAVSRKPRGSGKAIDSLAVVSDSSAIS
jgi:hypothetical protein